MAALASCSSKFDDDRDLQVLLDAFGSSVSLEVIASAYWQAKRDVDKAGEILYDLQGSTSSDTSYASGAQVNASPETNSAGVLNTIVEQSICLETTRTSKQKRCSVSMGTVSGVIGKGYARSWSSITKPSKTAKPLKLYAKEFPISETLNKENGSSTQSGCNVAPEDVEKFLLYMLGDGFQLDRNVMHEVLGSCGYDMRKSMKKLLDLSASTLEESDDIVGKASAESIGKTASLESQSEQGKFSREIPSESIAVESPKRKKDRYYLQREVLEALFTVPERSEEVVKVCKLREMRPRTIGKLVIEPVQVTAKVSPAEEPKIVHDYDTEDETFLALREAVTEYWNIMKEYYKAAVDSFAKGDLARAYKLLEEGHFYSRKAREADEICTQNVVEENECTKSEMMYLDLVDQEPKEARNLLKSHLTSLSGIPSIEYLKVIIGPGDGNARKGSVKRLITRLLEKESVKWTEEQSGEALLIRVDEVDPKNLSFA